MVALRVVQLRHTPWVCSRAICRSIKSARWLTQWQNCIDPGCCTRLESPAPWVAAGGTAPLPTDPAFTNVTGEGAAVGSVCQAAVAQTSGSVSSHCPALRAANPRRAPLAKPADDNGHGTHCSGTAAAVGNNSLGVVGLAYNVSLVFVATLAAGRGSRPAAQPGKVHSLAA